MQYYTLAVIPFSDVEYQWGKSFSVRVVNVWNKLTASVVEATSVNTIKKRLDEWMDVEV